MSSLPLPALLLFQDAGTGTASDLHWIMIFTGIIALFIVLTVVGLAIGALVAVTKISGAIKDAERKTQPLMRKSQELLGNVNGIVADLKPKIQTVSSDLEPRIRQIASDLQPKVTSISSDLQHISALLRSKTDEASQTFAQINSTVEDVNGKTREQVQRVNGLVTEALNTTQHVSRTIQQGIRVPVEKIGSWVLAAKMSIEHLAQKYNSGHTPGYTGSNPVRPMGPTVVNSRGNAVVTPIDTPIEKQTPPVG